MRMSYVGGDPDRERERERERERAKMIDRYTYLPL